MPHPQPVRNRLPGPTHLTTVALLAIATLTLPTRIAAQWRLEGWFGNAFNLPSRLTIEQDGHPELGIDADWSTRPWRPTWYYSARVAKWSGSSGWALEYMHHKLYLDNPTEEVPRFRITNGVNNLLVERHWRRSGWELGVGAGPSFAVPISTVRGQSYGESKGIFGSRYEFAGGTLYGTVARRVKLLPYTQGSFALKTTLTYLDVSVASGSARLTNLALHLQYGVSFQSSP